MKKKEAGVGGAGRAGWVCTFNESGHTGLAEKRHLNGTSHSALQRPGVQVQSTGACQGAAGRPVGRRGGHMGKSSSEKTDEVRPTMGDWSCVPAEHGKGLAFSPGNEEPLGEGVQSKAAT